MIFQLPSLLEQLQLIHITNNIQVNIINFILSYLFIKTSGSLKNQSVGLRTTGSLLIMVII